VKGLRLTEDDLKQIQARADHRKIKTHILDKKDAPKFLVQILMKDVKDAGLPEPVVEHRFHDVRKWRFDLAWIEDKVALEVEGGIWTQGRHSRGVGMEADMEKYNTAQLMGWTVLRYSTGQIKQGKPIEDLKRALA
jgi:very-short-patch-repair endonuclease